MKTRRFLCALSLLPLPLLAQEPAPPAAPEPAPARIPAYKPPKVGAPSVRVGAGSRGGDFDGVILQALAPDHPGRTFEAAPSLYWFQSKPMKARFEISVTASGQADTVLRRAGDGTQTAGIHRINLAAEKDANGKPIELKPGVTYKWTVALVADAASRSKDIVASGIVERVAPSEDLQARLAKASPIERACLLAEAGVWYDAFALLSRLTAENPKDPALREARSALVKAIDLKEAAAAAAR